MTRINISDWGDYTIGGENGLFKIINGKGITKQELFIHTGSIRAIQSGEENNGVIGYIDEQYCTEKGYYIAREPCLAVARSGSSGHVTYQEHPCVAGDSAKLLIPKVKLNKYQLLYLRTILMINKKKYHYNDKVNEARYAKDIIKLPMDAQGNPNWYYMEKYMKNLEFRSYDSLTKLHYIKQNIIKPVNITGWDYFHLYDDSIFEIDSGTKLDRIKMSEFNPTINFVGRANTNNGITAFVDEIEGIEPYKAGYLTLSLGGEYLGACFVQDKPFYTSQNVNVLIPKWDMPLAIKQFIAAIIFKEGRLHYKAFIDELNRHIKTDFVIPLPVDLHGKPNWNYMETYMMQIESRVKQNLEILIKVTK